MIYDLVPSNHPLLKQKLERFDFSNPPTDPVQLAKDLTETCIHHNGLGLSANQVGLPYRVFVMMGQPVFACFNPRLIDVTTEEIQLEEGCLSFPGLFIKIKRPRSIKVRYTMPNGETVTQTFTGMTARCFLHELDHMDGLLYTSKANPFHLDQARRRAKKFERQRKQEKMKNG